jgi:hypothetical protein
MIPEYLVMDAVDEVSILDTWLGHWNYPEHHVDRILGAIYQRLKNRSEAMCLLDEYLEYLSQRQYAPHEMDMIGPSVTNLFKASYHQLLDIRVYHPNGRMYYDFGGRQHRNKTLILAYSAE